MSSSAAPSVNTAAPPSSSPPLTSSSSPTGQSSSPTGLLSPQGRISLRSTSALSRDRYSHVSEQREEERRRGEEKEKREKEDRERREREAQQQLQREKDKESRENDGGREKERDGRGGGGRERHDRGDRQRRDDGRHLRERGADRDRGDRERKDRRDGGDDRRDRDRDRDRLHDGRDGRERDRGGLAARRTATSQTNSILRITPSSLAPSPNSNNNNNNNNNQRSPNPIAASPIDLSPSPQPAPSTASTALSLDSGLAHPLAHSWCLYFDRRTAKNKQLPSTTPAPANAAASASYENSLQLVSTFDTAEALLSLLHYLLLPSSLDFNSNYHLFRSGVRPIWEDEHNEAGGKWTAKANNTAQPPRVDGWWVRLLLRLVGETLGDAEDGSGGGGGGGDVVDDVNGCVFSRRRQGDRIAVWNRSREEGRIKALGAAIKQALTSGGGGSVQLAYDLHEDSMKAGSSYSNASRYTM